jgi:hypothetical protein
MSFIRGPLGSGKTQTTIMKMLLKMQEQAPNPDGIRPSRMFVVRNTYPDLLTTTIRDWSAVTGRIAPVKMGHPPTQFLRYRQNDGTWVECDVIFIALDREEHIRKLRGTQASIAWLNEVKELPFAVLEMMDARLGRYPSRALAGVDCSHGGLISGDTNAPDEDHWYATREGTPPDGWRFFIQPGAVRKVDGEWVVEPDPENGSNLPPSYYTKLLAGKRDEWIKVNLANMFGTTADGKPVWEEFNSDTHIKSFDVIPDKPVIYGADWGLTPAMVLAQEHNGQLLIFDEIVTERFSAEELAEAAVQRLSSQYPQLKWGHGWGDPSGTSGAQTDKKTPFMIMQAHNFNVIPAPTNDFSIRRDAVGNRLRRLTVGSHPAILIHPRCTVLKKGLAGHYNYRRIKISGDKFHDVPDKSMYSHICEALQYLSLGVGDGDVIMGNKDNPYTDWSKPLTHTARRFGENRNRLRANRR